MTTLVVAEKPSVARDIARVLGAGSRGEGFLAGNGWCVTWALGHLVQFAEPDDYGPDWKARWSRQQLPMVPERWKLKPAERTAAQLKLVTRLLKAPEHERVVCATDAGREGELIFRLIYEHARSTKPVLRLWVSSLTDEALRAGFASLKPGAAYDDLAQAARARAQADWLIGMNLTRAYTVHNRVLCTVGRVQTPTLAMIVARDAEIAAFTKAFFYELIAHLAEGFEAKLIRDGQTRIDDKQEAERLHAELSPHRTGTVKSIEREIRREPPPPLYDLTTLQRDANRRFGLTAAKVLEIAQQLYETHKLISYPRTESRHIGEDLVPKLPGILAGLDHPQAPAAQARLAAGHRLGRAYVDKTRLTDHHAILPTGKPVPAGLPRPLRQVYDLVQTRFVAVFFPDRVSEETRVLLDIGGADFIARGTRELDSGWRVADPPARAVRSARPDAAGAAGDGTAGQGTADPSAKPGGSDGPAAQDPESDQPLPPLETGQTVHVDGLEVRERETTPPRPYTDSTLLAAMKGAGRTLEDKDLARAMRASGLGTPATRAEIVEKLIRTGYVERQRRQLRSTEKGRTLIGAVALPLKSPELTARWEQMLKEVEEGARPVDAFYDGICNLVRELIPQVWGGPAFSPEQVAAARAALEARGGGGRAAGRGGRAGGTGGARGGGRATVRGSSSASTRNGSGRWGGSDSVEAGPGSTGGSVGGSIGRSTGGSERARSGPGAARQGSRTTARGKTSRRPASTAAIANPGQPTGTGASMGRPTRSARPAQVPPAGPSHPEELPHPAAPPGPTSTGPVGLTCPKCGRGHVIRGRRGYGCERWREGCDFVVWCEVEGKRLTDRQIADLIRRGRTNLLRGFVDGAGRPFAARLVLSPDGKTEVRAAEGTEP